MCGIAGIIQNNPNRFNRLNLEKMTRSIAHRGPDGEGFWQNADGTVLFGHRRLSIIDLTDAGQQPMHYLQRYVIIHNGEIYNYIELKDTLQQKGYNFSTRTDTEVIAAAYDCWKQDCLQHFDGMFAFAIYDKKEKVLFAARDRFGEKPFFYYYDNESFLFASEIKALWAAGIPKEPNLQLLFNFITIGYADNPEIPGETFYENISRLPAASYLQYSIEEKNFLVKNYWDIDVSKENKKISDDNALQQFEFLFQTSVNRRLRSDVDLGCSLSGGIDSSAIAATINASTAGKQSFNCFTAQFRDFDKDESHLAKIVADHLNWPQWLAPVTLNDFMNDWDKLCFYQDEPIGSSGAYAQYRVYELAAKQGVKVLLDGQGADEILAGYHKYFKWYWQELYRKMQLSRSGELKAARRLGINEPFTIKNKIAAWFPGFASIVMERQYLLKAIRQEDLDKDFVQLQSKEAYYTPPEYFKLNGLLYFNTRTHGLEELLRYADRNAMAHGREIRLPFLSHELVEFIFSLPSHFKIRNGNTKWLLRVSARTKLPARIVNRTDKIGFEPPQESWMKQKVMQDAVQEAKKVLVNEKILKSSVLNKPIAALPAYATDNYDWRYFSAASLFK
jgi:asparagine synthase (glutamine-hydrolysing)